MNKKALSREAILGAILAAVVLLVIISIFSGIFEKQGYLTHKEKCKDSVRRNYELGSLKGLAKADVECPVIYTTVPDATDSQIKRFTANLMKDTWEVYGRGKYDLFEGEGVYCAIYAIIDFKDETKQVGGFLNYLTQTPISGRGITYADYLSGYATPEAHRFVESYEKKENKKPEDVIIDTSKTYASILVYAKGTNAIGTVFNALGGKAKVAIGAGVVGGAAAGTLSIIALGTGPVGWVVGGVAVVGTGVYAAYRTYVADEDPNWTAMVLLEEWDATTLETLGCTELPIVQGKEQQQSRANVKYWG